MAFPLRTGILALLVVAAAAPATVAQQATMPRAFELERRGNYEAAADAYRECSVVPRATSRRSWGSSACCCR